MKLNNISLRWRFIIPTLGALILVMGIVGAWETKKSAQDAQRSLQSKAMALGGFLQKASASFISNYDNQALEKFVQTAKEDPEIAFLVFVDAKGKVLTQESKMPADTSGFLVVEKEIVEGSTPIGKVILGYDQSAMVQAQRTAVVGSLLGILLGVVVVGVIVFAVAQALTRQLAAIATSMEKSTAGVDASTQQLSETSQELSGGATSAASSLQETSASIEELTSMVKLNAENAKEASALSAKNREEAQKGEVEIKQLIEAMASISESSKKIEDIIGVIDDIAFQTNLLALNAAVEAARAGEQGKSFAVVAEAVRGLAQRSASSTKDIAALIKDSANRVQNGATIANRSGKVLEEIVKSVHKVADLNDKISNASHEQALGIEQINKAVTMLEQSTQKNASSAQAVAKSSQEMSDQARVFEGLVGEMTAVVYGSK